MKNRNQDTDDTLAVSEVVSYVLIFGLMSIGIALIYLQGTPAINSAEEDQINENSERAILLVQERLDEMVQNDAPRREVSIEMKDLTVGVGGLGNASRINITAEDTGGNVTSYNSSAAPVYIEAPRYTMLYENGAVLLGEQGNSDSWGMKSDPSWAVSTNSTDYVRTGFLRTVSTVGRDRVGGEGRIRFAFESIAHTNENINDVNELNITIRSPRANGWESYLGRLNGSINGSRLDYDPSNNRVSLEINEFADGSGTLSYDEKMLRAEVETG